MENDFFKPTHPTKVWKIYTFFVEPFPKTKLEKHDDNNVKQLSKSFNSENKFFNPNWILV